MSIVKIVVPTVAGALFPAKSDREISVAKGVKSPVVMTGYIGAPDHKDGEKYVPGPYGRLSVEAAKCDDRLVLAVAGGLRGVLFKDAGGQVDYSGNIEAGDGKVFPIFGRKRKASTGKTFVSLSSAEAEDPKKETKAAPAEAEVVEDDDIPF